MKYVYVRAGQLLILHVGYNQSVIDNAKEYFDRTIESQKHESGDMMVFTMIIEKLSTVNKEIFYQIMDICESYAKSHNSRCHFLLHDTAKFCKLNRPNIDYIDTWAWITYRHSEKRHIKRWYHKADKALFLVGKPLKLQRIGLLDQFHRQKLLEYLEYTFHFPVNRQNINAIKKLEILGLSEDDYISKLLIDLQKPSPDIDLEKQNVWSGFEYKGFPTSLSYYKNTCMSIVSENSFEINPDSYTGEYSTPYLTEKLFRAIINHHPFILIGDSGINEYVESLGYKTFNKFFLPFNSKVRYEANKTINWAVSSVKQFIDNKQQHLDEINDIVEHNYRVFVSRMENDINTFYKKFPKINLDHTELMGYL